MCCSEGISGTDDYSPLVAGTVLKLLLPCSCVLRETEMDLYQVCCTRLECKINNAFPEVAGFVAVWYNKLSVDRVKLLQGLAILQLFVTAINLVTGRGIGDKVRLSTYLRVIKTNVCQGQ